MSSRTPEEVSALVDRAYQELLLYGYSPIPEQVHKRYLTMMYSIGNNDNIKEGIHVEQLTVWGELVNEFKSARHASKVAGINRVTLSRIIDTDNSWNGFVFKTKK